MLDFTGQLPLTHFTVKRPVLPSGARLNSYISPSISKSLPLLPLSNIATFLALDPRSPTLSFSQYVHFSHFSHRQTFSNPTLPDAPILTQPVFRLPNLRLYALRILALLFKMSDNEQSPNGAQQDTSAGGEHLNIKVTDGNNEVFFKIKKSTKLDKLMRAFCERQGKDRTTVRFLFDGVKVNGEDTPDNVRFPPGCGILTTMGR